MHNKKGPDSKQTLQQKYENNVVHVEEQITKSMEPNAKFWPDLCVYRYLILDKGEPLAMSVTLHPEQKKKQKTCGEEDKMTILSGKMVAEATESLSTFLNPYIETGRTTAWQNPNH